MTAMAASAMRRFKSAFLRSRKPGARVSTVAFPGFPFTFVRPETRVRHSAALAKYFVCHKLCAGQGLRLLPCTLSTMVIWLIKFAMRTLMPRTDALPGIGDTDVDGFLRRMHADADSLYWTGLV